MLPALVWSEMVPADAQVAVVDCAQLPPFVPASHIVARCGVQLFQLPDLARCYPKAAQSHDGLRQLYEPYARLVCKLGLPLADFSVGRRNFRFTLRDGHRPLVPEWAAVVHKALHMLLNGSCGIKHSYNWVQIASDSLVTWDKYAAVRAMTDALAAHLTLKWGCTAEDAQLHAAAAASQIDVAVNPPTMQLHVSSQKEAKCIEDFFRAHTVLCDWDYAAWVEPAQHGALSAAVDKIRGNDAFKRSLSSYFLPRGTVNAELRRSTQPTVPTQVADSRVVLTDGSWRYEPYVQAR